MSSPEFFSEARRLGLKLNLSGEGSSPVHTLDNEALFQLPLLAMAILAISKGQSKPQLPEIGQLVGECLERTVAGFKRSSQDIGWSGNLRIRTIKALTFLESTGQVTIDEVTRRIAATDLGKKVYNGALEGESLLSLSMKTIELTLAEGTECMSVTMEFPGEAGHPVLRRRVVFGPASHYMATPHAQPSCPAAAREASEQDSDSDSESDEHDFCPCCLLTKSIDAFRPLLASGAFAAIRLYAARYADGEIQTDCRLNGEDYPAGQLALMDYVKTWPEMGFEFRKQLVVVRNLD